MKLKQVRCKNFKLLTDVTIDFSADKERPLTVVKAENGSGKTSLLMALIWALYGEEGLPPGSSEKGLGPKTVLHGEKVTVQVTVSFSQAEQAEVSDYTLTRTVNETRQPDGTLERSPEALILRRAYKGGMEEVQAPQSVVARFFPQRLESVFFTDGDHVERFVSGDGDNDHQVRVREAIKAILGLDQFRDALEDIKYVQGKIRKEVSNTGGESLKKVEGALSKINEDLEKQEEALKKCLAKKKTITGEKVAADKALAQLRGIGNIEELNRQLAKWQKELEGFEKREGGLADEMKQLTFCEDTSWAFGRDKLCQGFEVLDQLKATGVIPGTSLQVLKDRLNMGRCICDQDLSEGTDERMRVLALIEEQKKVSVDLGRKTELFHSAQRGYEAFSGNFAEEKHFQVRRLGLLEDYVENRNSIQSCSDEIKILEEKRSKIPAEKVQELESRRKHHETQLAECNKEIGSLEGEIKAHKKEQEKKAEEYKKEEKNARVNHVARVQRVVAEDLENLVSNSLDVLEGDSVEKVSFRMNKFFLDIVGGSEEKFKVFESVGITKDYDINVKSVGDVYLDPNFDVNGASKRALTLSFIWALMDVADYEAPRIVDSPLGYTSGAIRERIMEFITSNQSGEGSEFQVILFLTRSEIVGVEDILDRRSGVSQTLSCNKDYPRDLKNEWGDEALIRRCDCSHREICQICERHADGGLGLNFREVSTNV